MRNRRNSLGSLGGNVLGLGEVVPPNWGITNAVPQVPAACWSKANFSACQQWAIASPNADCAAMAKQGGWNDTSLKNCIEDKYRYRMTTYCIGSCGNGSVTWPGGPAADSGTSAPTTMGTLQLQQALNVILVPSGYAKLTEDGVLGPKTCGAAKAFMPSVVPTECATKGYTAPSKPSAAVAVKPSSSSALFVPAAQTSLPSAIPLTAAGMLGSAKWMIGASIAIALGLAGVAVAQKKGWIKPQGGFGAKPVKK